MSVTFSTYYYSHAEKMTERRSTLVTSRAVETLVGSSRNEKAFHPVLQVDSQTAKSIQGDEAYIYSRSKMNNKTQEKPKLTIGDIRTRSRRK
jgi:hypothetical protein